MKRYLCLFLSLTASFMLFAQTAIEPTGSGTLRDPYQITTLENLYWIAATDSEVPSPDSSTRSNATYIQTNDINASATRTWFPDGQGGYYGWKPISSFYGLYNGKNNFIDSLYINRPEEDGVAFIADIDGTISSLNLTNADVTGKYIVAVMAGQCGYNSFSAIRFCSTTGKVTSRGTAGGLAASCMPSEISYCYSKAEINVNGDRAGGLIGSNCGLNLRNCYSTGEINCTGSFKGGLIGEVLSEYNTENCFWDIESSGMSYSPIGIGKTTSEMKTQSIYTEWNFETVWRIDSLSNEGYPYILPQGLIEYQAPSAGDGTTGNPYVISNLKELYWICAPEWEVPNPSISQRNTYNYLQACDINASDTYAWNYITESYTTGWPCIGNERQPFKGTYNGQHYSIDSLKSIFGESDAGLFGYIDSASVSDVTLKYVDISGDYQTGGIAGYAMNNSFISGCGVTGSVSGSNNVAGICGYLHESEVNASFSAASVQGSTSGYAFGGIAGFVDYTSVISDSYSRSPVSGGSYTGGLAGSVNRNSAVTDCYSAGSVSGSGYTGGLIGHSSESFITGCFWDIEKSNQTVSSGGTAKTTLEMQTGSTYTSAGWDFLNVWKIDGIENAGYPYFLWQTFYIDTPSVSIFCDQAVDQYPIIMLDWNTVPDAVQYKIYSSIDPDAEFPADWVLEAATTRPGCSFVLSDPESTKKFYVVVAEN